jgi:hypothetical protein
MTGLFARLYLDEDAGRMGAPDRDQLHFAASQNRLLVTYNRF